MATFGATVHSNAIGSSTGAVPADARDTRQKELIPPEELANSSAYVFGCGAIGRQVVYMLSAMGVPRIAVWDNDMIEVVNLGPQAWTKEQIGQNKAVATATFVKSFVNSDTDVLTLTSEFTSTTRIEDIQSSSSYGFVGTQPAYFCCVDSIETRKDIYKNPNVCHEPQSFWTDGRMAGEVIRIVSAVSLEDKMSYLNTLFSANEAFEGACTTQSTVYSASLAAGLMVSQFAKWLRDAPFDKDLTFSIGSNELSPTFSA
jgi:hypothetical protein